MVGRRVGDEELGTGYWGLVWLLEGETFVISELQNFGWLKFKMSASSVSFEIMNGFSSLLVEPTCGLFNFKFVALKV